MELDLRDKASEALAAKKRKEEEQAVHDSEYHNYLVRCDLARLLGCKYDDIPPGNIKAKTTEYEGITFAHPLNHSGKDLRIVYFCRKCQGTVLSVPITDLAHLGSMLELPELDPKAPKCVERAHIPVHAADVGSKAKKDNTRVVDL